MSATPRSAQEAVREALQTATREELPAILAEVLAAVLAVAPAPTSASPSARVEGGRVLTPAEVAERVGGFGPDWAYRHRAELPTVNLPGGRWGVPEAALAKWISRRTS
jgi:hypothetical protein